MARREEAHSSAFLEAAASSAATMALVSLAASVSSLMTIIISATSPCVFVSTGTT